MLIYKIFLLIYIINSFAKSIEIQLLKNADELFDKNDFYNAKKIYETILNNPQTKEKSLARLILCQFFLQQKSDAYQNFKIFINEFPDSNFLKEILPPLIDYLKFKKDYNQASSLLEKYFKKFPELKNELLELYENSENFEKALLFLENNFEFSKWFLIKKTKYLIELKKYDIALDFAQQYLSNFNDPEIYKLVAEIYYKKSDFVNMEKNYKIAFNLSKNVQYIIEPAKILALNNKRENASAILNSLFEVWGYDKLAFERVAKIYKEIGLYQKLLKLYDDAQKKYGYDFSKEKILILEILGKDDEAINEYINLLDEQNFNFVRDKLVNLAVSENKLNVIEKIINKKLENSEIQLKEKILKILYYIYIELNLIDKAEEAITRYVNLNKIDYNFINSCLNDLLSRNEFKRLKKIFNNFKNLDDSPQFIILNYAKTLYELKEYDEALKILNRLNEAKLKDEVNLLKAKIYFKKGEYDNSLKISKNYNNNFDIFLIYLKNLAKTKNFDEAEKIINKEFDNKNFKTDVLYYEKAIILLFKGYEGEAKENFKKLLQIYPDSEYANNVALYLFLWDNEFIKNEKEKKENFFNFLKNFYLENFSEAILNLNKIYVPNTNLEDISNFLIAKCYFLNEDYDSAINILTRIIKNENRIVMPFALELLGDIYFFKKENKSVGINYYKILIDKFPNHPEIGEIRNRIASFIR